MSIAVKPPILLHVQKAGLDMLTPSTAFASTTFLFHCATDPIIVARASSEQELRDVQATDPLQQLDLAEYEVFPFGATYFPKRSSAFETFASRPLRELPPMRETEV